MPAPPPPDDPTSFKPIVVTDPDAPLRCTPSHATSSLRSPADRARQTAARWLAAVLGLLVLVLAVPALGHLNPATAPGWARIILLVAALQVAYLVWLAIVPDWSTLWVTMLMFAVVATLCAVAMAVGLATPPDRTLPLGLDAVRDKMAQWSAAALLLNALATWLCGRSSVRWRRATAG